MKTTPIISMKALHELKKAQTDTTLQVQAIDAMDKLELLEEMIRFQEQRSDAGRLTLSMLVLGKHLFSALERTSETQEMQLLARSYHRHLEYELEEFLRTGKLSEPEEEAV